MGFNAKVISTLFLRGLASSTSFLLQGARSRSPSLLSTKQTFPTIKTLSTTNLMTLSSKSSTLKASSVSISDAYDGGNIQLLDSSTPQDGKTTVSLNIKPDPYTELEKKNHFQYFSFRSLASGFVDYSIENANEASYASAWEESTVFYSKSLNDPHAWRRKLDTQFKDGKLTWSHNHGEQESVYFAYFPPFSYARHLDLIEKCSQYAKVDSLVQSLEGRDIECITAGSGERVCWIIHRQHPGEHMAEFFAEGLLTRLLGLDAGGDVDGLVHRLLKMYTFYVVPNMNPDGAISGHLRVNAAGANLNREWADSDDYKAPTMERSPEVKGVLDRMDQVGCDVFLDVHGDEALPYNFLAQPVVPNWGSRLESLHGAFLASYCRANPDMQQEYAYAVEYFQEGDKLNIASDQVAFRYDCLSVTLEMPFKDCWSNKNPSRGWTPARAQKLGASALDALMYIHPFLRTPEEFWKDLPEEDSYITPTNQYK